MSKLRDLVEALALDNDVEGLTRLLEKWPRQNDEWEGFVTARIYAPSSSKEQKKRLRAVRGQWKKAVRNGETERTPFPDTPPLKEELKWTVSEARISILERLHDAYRNTEKRIQSLQDERSEYAASANDLCVAIKRENSRIETQRRAFHQSCLESDPDSTEARFEDFIADIEHVFATPFAAASALEIERLSSHVKRSLPQELTLFYHLFGALDAEFGDGQFGVQIASPSKALSAMQAEGNYDRQRGLGLMDMIQWSWGNSRTEYEVDNGFDQSEIDRFNEVLCVGTFYDGYCESHAYIIEVTENRFGVFAWHQDYVLEYPKLENIRQYGLMELINTVIVEYEQKRAESKIDAVSEDDIDLEFNVDSITSLLNQAP